MILKLIHQNEHLERQKLWLDLSAKLLQGLHPNRIKEWALGRTALELALEEAGVKLLPSHEFQGFQEIKNLPGYKFSLSHTKGWAGALVMESEVPGLGLDIELRSRPVKENVRERIRHLQDVEMDGLVLWTLKEAIYKSLPLDVQRKTWLKGIAVKKGTYQIDGETMSGTWETSFTDQLVVSKAVRHHS